MPINLKVSVYGQHWFHIEEFYCHKKERPSVVLSFLGVWWVFWSVLDQELMEGVGGVVHDAS